VLCFFTFPPVSWPQSFAQPELVLQTSHTKRVTALAFSADGRWLASTSDDHMIKLWEVSTGLQLRSLPDVAGGSLAEHEHAVAFSPDRRWIALARDSAVGLWDTATGTRLWSKSPEVKYDSYFYDVAFSPDGHWLAVGATDAVRLWTVPAGTGPRTLTISPVPPADTYPAAGRAKVERLRLLAERLVTSNRSLYAALPKGHAIPSHADASEDLVGNPQEGANEHHKFIAVAFSRDGHRVAAAEAGGPVRLWDVETGDELPALPGQCKDCEALAFGPDGHHLVSAGWSSGDDLNVTGWDPMTGSLLFANPAEDLDTGPPLRQIPGKGHGGATAVALRPDGTWLAAASRDGNSSETKRWTVGLWNVETGEELRTLEGQGPMCYSLALSRDGSSLACGEDHGVVRLWDLTTKSESRALGAVTEVTGVGFSPDGRLLVTVGQDSVKIWDLAAGSELRTLGGITFISTGFSSNGHVLVSGFDEDSGVKLWDVAPGGQLLALPAGDDNFAAFSPDGRWGIYPFDSLRAEILSGVRELATGRELRIPAVPVEFSPDGRWLAYPSSGAGNSVTLRELASGRELSILPNQPDPLNVLAFSPDGRWLACGGKRYVKLWDLVAWRESQTFPAPEFSYHRILFGAGRWLAFVRSLGVMGDVTVWDRVTGAPPRRFPGRPWGDAVAFSPDGRWLASARDDRTVGLLELATGKEVSLRGHTDSVTSVAFSPDGRWLASGGEDGDVRIWNVEKSKGLVSVVPFSDAGKWLVAAPDGLFDGTADAIRQVAWRTGGTKTPVAPLESFFTDYFHAGLLADALSDNPPRAQIDIATVLQIPGLRTMLANKQAHLETRVGKAMVCFQQKPGVAVQAVADGGPDLPAEMDGYRVVPGDRTCSYQKELPAAGDVSQLVAKLQNWKPEVFTTRWDGQPSDTAKSTLHVLTVGVGEYLDNSGFDPLPYAAQSARAIEGFFTQQAMAARSAYAQIRVWPALCARGDTTRDAIRQKLADMAQAMSENDVAFLYLAGHGVVTQQNEMFYFVPSDGRDQAIRDTGLNTAMLADALRSMPARRIVLVIDACQSGGAVEALSKIGETKARAELRRAQPEERGILGLQGGVGVYIIAATMPLAYAVQLGSGHSALAEVTLEALCSKPGSITIRQLIEYLQRRQPEVSSKEVGFRQVPLTTSIGLDFALAIN